VPTVRTPTLEIGYEEWGEAAGAPVVLLHGFPDDAHAWDGVAPPLAARRYRVLAPYLRGYGPTRFLDAGAPRMAQQAAIGQDLLDFMDAVGIERAALAGYDWGGRAACIAAILAPARVRALVTIGGYNVQNTLAPSRPASAFEERMYWYQWYFNTRRGVAGLEQNRHDICKFLWKDWSPTWRFDDAEYDEFTFRAKPGDMFVFFSDGILDARNTEGELFGRQRVEQIVARCAGRPADYVVDCLFKAVEEHAAGVEAFDDQTVVAIKVKESPTKSK